VRVGIAGLALGVLNSSNNGNGLLGGLFGGGNQNVVSALQAELKCCCEKQVLPEFVDTRLMPSAPSTMKWLRRRLRSDGSCGLP
jgi:hypothetical protein